MRSLSRRAAPAAAVALAVPLLLVMTAGGVLVAPAATAAPARGWIVDRVRFVPIDESRAPLAIAATGTYRGAIEVRPGGVVVNEVGLEDYVKGVAEVPATWPAEALKAQAIAARTYALHQMTRLRTGPDTDWRAAGAHICATQACQVYAGLEKERQTAWAKAVEDTRGQALVWRGGPILAMYSSANGGYSVPGGQPYLRSVRDPDDAASPLHRWRYALPLSTVGAAFEMPGVMFDVGRAGDQVVLTSRLEDGTQHQTSMPATAFRERLNATVPPPEGLPRTVPSVRFTVFTNGDGVVIDGRGFGHGVGMSQFGALGKARRGMKAADILASYYAGLRPVAVPQLPDTIRVAVATGRAEVRVTSAGRFRVLDGAGQPIAVLGSGTWTVRDAGRGRVRVVPPGGADAPLILTPVGYDAERGMLRVRLNLTTDVQATLLLDGESPQPLPSQMLDPGDRDIALPPLRPGPVVVLLAANAGAGRTAAIEHRFTVEDAARARPRADDDRDGTATLTALNPVAVRADLRWALPALAGTLVTAAACGGFAYRSRRRRSS